MRWTEKKHRWALDIDGRLYGSDDRKNSVATMTFPTRRDARWFVNTYSWDIKPRIVKVIVSYIELVNE